MGQKNSERADKFEMVARVQMAAVMLSQGRRKSEIKRAFAAQHGIKHRQVGRYIRLAHKELVAATDKSLDELVAESYGLYMRIIQDPDATARDKIAARKCADDLLGLPKAKKIALTTVAGDDMLDVVVEKLSWEQMKAIDEVAKIAEAEQARAADKPREN